MPSNKRRTTCAGLMLSMLAVVPVGSIGCKEKEPPGPPIEPEFAILEDVSKPEAERLEAFRKLRDEFKHKDFSKRNLSKLTLPTKGWKKLYLLFREANFSDTVLRGAELEDMDLTKANFTNADLRGVDFWASELRGVILAGANAEKAEFAESRMLDANCRGANLAGTDFSDSRIAGIDFTDANLSHADFIRADLNSVIEDTGKLKTRKTIIRNADFTGAVLESADFRNMDGIETAKFTGATYDAKTLFSQGFDPEKAGMKKVPVKPLK